MNWLSWQWKNRMTSCIRFSGVIICMLFGAAWSPGAMITNKRCFVKSRAMSCFESVAYAITILYIADLAKNAIWSAFWTQWLSVTTMKCTQFALRGLMKVRLFLISREMVDVCLSSRSAMSWNENPRHKNCSIWQRSVKDKCFKWIPPVMKYLYHTGEYETKSIPSAFIPRSLDNEPLRMRYTGSCGSTRLRHELPCNQHTTSALIVKSFRGINAKSTVTFVQK